MGVGYSHRMDGITIGTVPYLNALPLTAGLSGLVRAVPGRLAAMFREGALDVALLPIFEWVRDPSRPIVGSGAICSPGPVDSVLLFSRVPPEQARTVWLDESSLSSTALVKVLFAEHFKAVPDFSGCGPNTDPREVDADAVLLIGDPALKAPRDGLIVTDLAGAWRSLTSLPFCFAAWLARDEKIAERVTEEIEEARERGLASRHAIAERESPEMGIPAEVLYRYLTTRITYDLGEQERAAIRRFAQSCRELALV